MKTALLIGGAMVVLVLVSLFVWGLKSKSGMAPGLVQGRLAKCPETPNCVASEYPQDGEHTVAPIPLPADYPDPILPLLQETIQESGGTVQRVEDHYLAATFTSAIFRFVDDLELRIDPRQEVIHIRSASRVGRRDGGVNRRRVEKFRARVETNLAKARELPLQPPAR